MVIYSCQFYPACVSIHPILNLNILEPTVLKLFPPIIHLSVGNLHYPPKLPFSLICQHWMPDITFGGGEYVENENILSSTTQGCNQILTF